MSDKIKLSTLKANPGNPRRISEAKMDALKKSLSGFEQMMTLRPIVVDETWTVLGGNMRLQALKQLGHKEIPREWVKVATDLTEEQKREFIIKDNVGFGEWDWDILGNEWEAEQLGEWGLEVPGWTIAPSDDELTGEERNKPPTMKITFESPEQLQKAEIDIQELIDRKYQGAYFSVSAGEI
jgi:hypothetical protein